MKQPKPTKSEALTRDKNKDNFLDRQDAMDKRLRRVEEVLQLGGASADVLATRLRLTTDQGRVFELILVELTQEVNGEVTQMPTLMAEEVLD